MVALPPPGNSMVGKGREGGREGTHTFGAAEGNQPALSSALPGFAYFEKKQHQVRGGERERDSATTTTTTTCPKGKEGGRRRVGLGRGTRNTWSIVLRRWHFFIVLIECICLMSYGVMDFANVQGLKT